MLRYYFLKYSNLSPSLTCEASQIQCFHARYESAKSCAWRADVLACSRAWRVGVLTYWRACGLTCLRAYVLGVFGCFAYVLPMMRAWCV